MATLFDEALKEEKKLHDDYYAHWVETHTRPTHPETSMEAAEEIAPNVNKTVGLALDMLESYPNRTASELDAIAGHGNGTIRKRLSDLRRLGLATTGQKRRCTKTGRMAQVWKAT